MPSLAIPPEILAWSQPSQPKSHCIFFILSRADCSIPVNYAPHYYLFLFFHIFNTLDSAKIRPHESFIAREISSMLAFVMVPDRFAFHKVKSGQCEMTFNRSSSCKHYWIGESNIGIWEISALYRPIQRYEFYRNILFWLHFFPTVEPMNKD